MTSNGRVINEMKGLKGHDRCLFEVLSYFMGGGLRKDRKSVRIHDDSGLIRATNMPHKSTEHHSLCKPSRPVYYWTNYIYSVGEKKTQVYCNLICQIYISATFFFTVVPCILILSKFYLPTDAQENCFKKNIKIYIKVAPTRFGAITIISERIIWAC